MKSEVQLPENICSYAGKELLAGMMKALSNCPTDFGLFLSGGLDSTMTLALLRKLGRRPACFTIGGCPNHPDVKAAMSVAHQFNVAHYVYMPSEYEIRQAREAIQSRDAVFEGDDAVWLACMFAARHVPGVIITDGLDEQLGGYWEHINNPVIAIWEKYWNKVHDGHVRPLLQSAGETGLSIFLPYMQPFFVSVTRQIPISLKVQNGVGKAILRDIAREFIPPYIIRRPKLGFVSALEKGGDQ